MIWSFRVLVVPGGVELRPRRSQEVKGSPELQNGGLRALEEAWDDFLLEAFSCQVCSFSVVLGRLKLVPEGVELRPWRSLEVKGSPELQNGGLRALEEVWDDLTRRAFTSCFSYNAQRIIRKRENDELYQSGPKRNLG